MPSYINEFLLARARTDALGLLVEPFEMPNSPSRLTHQHGVELMAIASRELAAAGELQAQDVACRCAQVSRALKGHLERVTGQSAALTVGVVSYSGTPLIETHESLREMARTGSYHVWLTLPWFEIVDFTLQLSIAVLKGLPLDRVAPLAGYPESLGPYSWKPLFVGAAATDALLDAS